VTTSERPEPAFLCPLRSGHADRLRALLLKLCTGVVSQTERESIREAALVLLSDRESWDKYVTNDTQERMRYLFQNQADLPMEALVWIVKTNRGEPTE